MATRAHGCNTSEKLKQHVVGCCVWNLKRFGVWAFSFSSSRWNNISFGLCDFLAEMCWCWKKGGTSKKNFPQQSFVVFVLEEKSICTCLTVLLGSWGDVDAMLKYVWKVGGRLRFRKTEQHYITCEEVLKLSWLKHFSTFPCLHPQLQIFPFTTKRSV